jgi:hypothetical protein
LKNQKLISSVVIRRRTYNTMIRRLRTKRQPMLHKTLHTKHKTEQQLIMLYMHIAHVQHFSIFGLWVYLINNIQHFDYEHFWWTIFNILIMSISDEQYSIFWLWAYLMNNIQYFDYEHIWWTIFQKLVVHTKLNYLRTKTRKLVFLVSPLNKHQ